MINQRTSYDSTDTSSLDSSNAESYDTGHANLDVAFTDQSPTSRLRKSRSSPRKLTQKEMKKPAKLNTNKSKTYPPAKKIKVVSCVTLTEKQTKCLKTSSKNDASLPEIDKEMEAPHYDNPAVSNPNTREPCDSLSCASLADLNKGKEYSCFESSAVICNDIDFKIGTSSPAMNTQSDMPASHCETCDANSFENPALSDMYNEEDTYTGSTDANKIGICDDYLDKKFVTLADSEDVAIDSLLSLRGSSNGSPVNKQAILSKTDKQDSHHKNLPVDDLPSCSTYDKNLVKTSIVPPEIEKPGIYAENIANINLVSCGTCDDKSVKTCAISPEKQVTKPDNFDIENNGSYSTYGESPVINTAVLSETKNNGTFRETYDDTPVNSSVILPETDEKNTYPENLAFDELESRNTHLDNSINDSAILPETNKLDNNSKILAIDDLGSCGIHEDDSSKNSAVLPELEVYDDSIIDYPSNRAIQDIDITKKLNTQSETLCENTGKMLISEINHEDSGEKECQSIPLEKKRKRSRPKTLLHKSYIDFMSEAEEDFSAGSSDLWSGNESDSDTGNETKKKNKKRSKKHALKTKEIAIKERVKMRNESKYRKSRKNSGKSYITRSGSNISEKSMKENPCQPDKCQRKCYEIPDTRRKSLFDHFWSLDPQRRRDWIVRCVRTTQIKRKKTKITESRRQWTHEYVINEGEGFRPVCQQFILSTLDITQKFILYNVSNSNDGIAKEDARKCNVPPKYSADAKEYVKQYIKSLPAVPSHYCRGNSTRLYLPQEFKNVTNLYRLYCLDCIKNCMEKVSERVFTSIFKTDFNLSFHVPKKDKCLVCLKAENDDEKTDQDIENFNNHLEEKKAGYKRFKIHQNLKGDTLNNLKLIGADSFTMTYTQRYSTAF